MRAGAVRARQEVFKECCPFGAACIMHLVSHFFFFSPRPPRARVLGIKDKGVSSSAQGGALPLLWIVDTAVKRVKTSTQQYTKQKLAPLALTI